MQHGLRYEYPSYHDEGGDNTWPPVETFFAAEDLSALGACAVPQWRAVGWLLWLLSQMHGGDWRDMVSVQRRDGTQLTVAHTEIDSDPASRPEVPHTSQPSTPCASPREIQG